MKEAAEERQKGLGGGHPKARQIRGGTPSKNNDNEKGVGGRDTDVHTRPCTHARHLKETFIPHMKEGRQLS